MGFTEIGVAGPVKLKFKVFLRLNAFKIVPTPVDQISQWQVSSLLNCCYGLPIRSSTCRKQNPYLKTAKPPGLSFVISIIISGCPWNIYYRKAQYLPNPLIKSTAILRFPWAIFLRKFRQSRFLPCPNQSIAGFL